MENLFFYSFVYNFSFSLRFFIYIFFRVERTQRNEFIYFKIRYSFLLPTFWLCVWAVRASAAAGSFSGRFSIVQLSRPSSASAVRLGSRLRAVCGGFPQKCVRGRAAEGEGKATKCLLVFITCSLLFGGLAAHSNCHQAPENCLPRTNETGHVASWDPPPLCPSHCCPHPLPCWLLLLIM